MKFRSMTAFVAGAFMLSGCDKPPPTTSVEKPATPAGGISDPDAMRSLVQSERGVAPSSGGGTAAAGTGAGVLPPGHPPIDGGAAAAQPAGGDAATASTGDGALPPGHPPIDSGAGAVPPANPAGAGALPPDHPPLGGAPLELKFDTPSDWTLAPLTPGLGRKAQYVLPKADGDPEDGEAIVYFFGTTQGGNVALNLSRWRSAFSAPDGSPLPEDASKTDTYEVGGLKITLLDVTGRYTPMTMGQAGASGPKDNYRMLGAVIETPGGNWFVKATGPAATMEKNREAMVEFLKSAKM